MFDYFSELEIQALNLSSQPYQEFREMEVSYQEFAGWDDWQQIQGGKWKSPGGRVLSDPVFQKMKQAAPKAEAKPASPRPKATPTPQTKTPAKPATKPAPKAAADDRDFPDSGVAFRGGKFEISDVAKAETLVKQLQEQIAASKKKSPTPAAKPPAKPAAKPAPQPKSSTPEVEAIATRVKQLNQYATDLSIPEDVHLKALNDLTKLPKNKVAEVAESFGIRLAKNASGPQIVSEIKKWVIGRRNYAIQASFIDGVSDDRYGTAPDELRGGKSAAKPTAAPSPQSQPAAPRLVDKPTPEFAAEVKSLVDNLGGGARFGNNKVWIGRAYEEAKKKDPSLSEEEFKRKLVEANRAGKITLTRADLAAHMDQDDVRKSETRYANSEFHFITDESLPFGAGQEGTAGDYTWTKKKQPTTYRKPPK